MASAVASLSSPPAMGVQWSNGVCMYMCVRVSVHVWCFACYPCLLLVLAIAAREEDWLVFGSAYTLQGLSAAHSAMRRCPPEEKQANPKNQATPVSPSCHSIPYTHEVWIVKNSTDTLVQITLMIQISYSKVDLTYTATISPSLLLHALSAEMATLGSHYTLY